MPRGAYAYTSVSRGWSGSELVTLRPTQELRDRSGDGLGSLDVQEMADPFDWAVLYAWERGREERGAIVIRAPQPDPSPPGGLGSPVAAVLSMTGNVPDSGTRRETR
jgi:hypothetical protein